RWCACYQRRGSGGSTTRAERGCCGHGRFAWTCGDSRECGGERFGGVGELCGGIDGNYGFPAGFGG
ncbi:hypothetical protein SB776_37945, partial [Burkholderia sp. SIMBA_045]